MMTNGSNKYKLMGPANQHHMLSCVTRSFLIIRSSNDVDVALLTDQEKSRNLFLEQRENYLS